MLDHLLEFLVFKKRVPSTSWVRRVYIVLFYFSFILILSPPVEAIGNQFYSDNLVLFHDPNAGTPTQACSTSGGSSAPLSGRDQKSKIWSWLIAEGMSEQGAAGIMGNMQAESGFNPFRFQVSSENYNSLVNSTASDKAWGLVQWDGGRRPEVLKYIVGKNTDYKQYIDAKYGKSAESYKEAPSEVNDAFITLSLEFMHKEMTTGYRGKTWERMLAANSPEKAADNFEKYFEGSTRQGGGVHSKFAKEIFDEFTGQGSVPVVSANSGSDTSSACDNSNSNGDTAEGGGGVITEGGLTEDQAKKLVMNYGANIGNDSAKVIGSSYWASCSPGGKGSNCVSFSRFFINKFSKKQAPTPMGDGKAVVGKMGSAGFKTGKKPQVFAVFSTPATSGNSYGHTGVVLGIHGDTVIVGHASCGRGRNGIGGKGNGTMDGSGSAFIRVGKISKSSAWWTSVPSEFAYPEVDVNKIQDYVNGKI